VYELIKQIIISHLIPFISVLAGDGFAATSNFEGCVSSALSAATSVLTALQK